MLSKFSVRLYPVIGINPAMEGFSERVALALITLPTELDTSTE
jgi:hypothetical protein